MSDTVPGLPEGVTPSVGGPPVSLSLFIEALGALRRTSGSRLMGSGSEVDEIRKHLGHAEAIYRTLPEDPNTKDNRAADLEDAAKAVEAIRREAHDFGLEAFPEGFWESCDLVEGALRGAADRLRDAPPAPEIERSQG